MQLSDSETSTGMGSRDRRRFRKRSGKDGGSKAKTFGFASIAVPIAGYVIKDLRKPDSIIRGLLGLAVAKFLPAKKEKKELIDITDKVEVIEEKSGNP